MAIILEDIVADFQPNLYVYSDRYSDDVYEYRHVILTPQAAKKMPKWHLLTETEWRNIGVQQSPGWVHYMHHGPEPHVLLFRRPKSHPIPSDFGRHPANMAADS